MDSPAARASRMSSPWSAWVTLRATGLLRLSFAFFGGLPIFFFLFVMQAMYFTYTHKSSAKFRNSAL